MTAAELRELADTLRDNFDGDLGAGGEWALSEAATACASLARVIDHLQRDESAECAHVRDVRAQLRGLLA